jgi:hypothetical protein
MPNARLSPRAAVLIGGLLAGAIDLGAACLITGQGPVSISQTIAGGLLGKAAFAGGFQTALLGLLLQEVMGVLIAAVYYCIRKLLPALTRNWVAGGLGFGVIVFFVMNYAVVPLSAWHRVPHFAVKSFAENMLAMLLFGLIVSYFSARSKP